MNGFTAQDFDQNFLTGDTQQHQGVEAGRPFEQLQRAGMCTAKLEQIVSQKDRTFKATVELLARGRSTKALMELCDLFRVEQIPDRQERIRPVAQM